MWSERQESKPLSVSLDGSAALCSVSATLAVPVQGMWVLLLGLYGDVGLWAAKHILRFWKIHSTIWTNTFEILKKSLQSGTKW